jgi:hypothetical protein
VLTADVVEPHLLISFFEERKEGRRKNKMRSAVSAISGVSL